jgi:hypothetical protein
MTAECSTRDAGRAARNIAAVLACLLLTGCAASSGASDWARAGADAATISHEAADCRTQADDALATERGINQDISATLGRNWQLSGTTQVVDQSMRQQSSGYAEQVFDSCMRAKGFRKAG